jgi:D-3-phosphoglycerate dehydrogenase
MIHPNSGHDNIKQDFVKEASFPIILGNPIRSNAVCEYTLSCLFHHYTKIDNHLHWSHDRVWDRKLLRDQRVLILGYGHIGKILKASLSPLCREVLVYDPFHEDSDESVIQEFDKEIFNDIDVLLVSANLNHSSHQLVNHEVLKRLSSDAVIINPARGEIVKESDLVQFLQKNPKATAYLDVFEEEPFEPGYLHDLPNLNKTSHIAGVFERLNNDIISFEYLIIKDFLKYYRGHELSDFKEEYAECILKDETFIREVK